MAEETKAFETTFTKEAIIGVSNAINTAIGTYAKAEGVNGKLDIFVILAGLGQVAYDTSMTVLPVDEEQRKKIYDEMKMVTENLIKKIDALHVEHGHSSAADIVASAHFMSLIAELYSKRRDAVVQKTLQDQAQPQEVSAQ